MWQTQTVLNRKKTNNKLLFKLSIISERLIKNIHIPKKMSLIVWMICVSVSDWSTSDPSSSSASSLAKIRLSVKCRMLSEINNRVTFKRSPMSPNLVYRLCSNIYYITISSMSPNLVYRLCSNIYYITISSMSPNLVYRLCSNIYYILISPMSPNLVYRLCSYIYYITISSMSPNLVYRLCSYIYYITISSMSPNLVYRLCSYI